MFLAALLAPLGGCSVGFGFATGRLPPSRKLTASDCKPVRWEPWVDVALAVGTAGALGWWVHREIDSCLQDESCVPSSTSGLGYIYPLASGLVFATSAVEGFTWERKCRDVVRWRKAWRTTPSQRELCHRAIRAFHGEPDPERRNAIFLELKGPCRRELKTCSPYLWGGEEVPTECAWIRGAGPEE